MAKLPVSNDFIANEVKSTIPYIFSSLKKFYKDIKFKTEEELGIVYMDYLEFTYKKYSTVKTLLYKNEGKHLYDFYEHTSLKSDTRSEIKTDNTELIFDEKQNVIITGTGGIGKSMLVKHIFINQVQQATTIPIFIELKSLNDFEHLEKTLEDFIYVETYNNHLNLEREYFISTLKLGKYTIIFDGLDEVVASKRQWLDKAIKDFVSLYDKNRYVLSSRPSEVFIGWDNFIEYEMKVLSKEQALSLVNKLDYDSKIKKAFYRDLKDFLYVNHESFASIPLLLTIMLMTFEAGASIPNNLTDFYNQAFYTLYQRHDASKSGYKCELKTKLSPEEFKSVLSYVGMKTFFDSQVDFNTSTVDKAIRRYQEKINIKMSSFDFIFDATNSACMLIQEGTDLKFSHRSFQEYFAALGINQLDDKLQKQILLQWVKEDRNNISAHKTFMNSLFSIQKERTYKNLCLPVIEKMEELYLGMPDIDFVIQNCFKHFRLAKGKTNQKGIGFGLADDYAYYFSLQFIIFHSIGKDISSVHNKEEVELLEMKLYDLLEEDQRYSFNDLVEEEKVLLRQWIDNWYMARHRFLKQWAKEFVENSSTQKRTLQNIMNSI